MAKKVKEADHDPVAKAQDRLDKAKKIADLKKQISNVRNEDGHVDVASAIRHCKTIIEDCNDIMSKLNGMGEELLPSWLTDKITVPSISGKTIGTSSFFELAVGQHSNTGTSAYDLNITGVQVEVGEVATAFEHRSYGDELARCERYCQVFEYTGQYHLICQGIIETGATIENIFYLRRPMRTFPSCTLSNIANFRLNDFRGNDEDADAFIGISRVSLSTANLKFRKPTSNMDPGRAGYINAATSSGATMTFSAEL